MESAINTVRNYFKKKTSVECDAVNVPQIGFKVSFSESTKELKVKVIGARQLPVEIGNSKPRGYLVKVTVYPQKAKFETKVAAANWPTINEEFTCQLILPTKRIEDTFKGTFVCFTIYAIVGRLDEEKPAPQSQGILKRYLSYNDTPDEIIPTTASARRFSMNNSLRRNSNTNALNSRRTIGAVPYTLERKIFTQKLRNGVVGTPDIWRNITEIKSGIQTQPRDGTKGSIEITLQYGLSEDGTNDVVEVTVTKFRCSLQTMHGHEKIGGQLYIKITAFEQQDLIQKMKSDKFDPTISLKLEASSSTLRATVNKYNLNQVKILIRLMGKNVLGTKVLLGKIEITSKHHFFKEIISSPAIPITKMVNFE